MNGTDIIAIIALVVIIGGAIAYIIHAKKSGKKCIGCPDSGSCSHNCKGCTGSCGCSSLEADDKETK